MRKESKSQFADKFKSYIDSKIKQSKAQQLFGSEFAYTSTPSKQKTPQIKAQNSKQNYSKCQGNSSSGYSFNSSEFQYQKICKSSKLQVKEESTQKRRRLKKLRELQQNQCAICLDQITNRCQLECKHKFCFDCLQEWFTNSNKCPYCRTQVHLFWHKGEQYHVEPKDFQYEGDQQDNIDWVCYNCDRTSEGDIVLICDRCEANACHIECDPSLRGVQPVGDWYCHYCR